MCMTFAAALEEIGEGPCDETGAIQGQQAQKAWDKLTICTHQGRPQVVTNSVYPWNCPREIPLMPEVGRQGRSVVPQAVTFY